MKLKALGRGIDTLPQNNSSHFQLGNWHLSSTFALGFCARQKVRPRCCEDDRRRPGRNFRRQQPEVPMRKPPDSPVNDAHATGPHSVQSHLVFQKPEPAAFQ